jgi:hypothetical protein
MLDPSTQTATAWAAAASGVTLALLGVDYHSLLYALLGAMMARYQGETMLWGRAVWFVVLSTLAGAVIGSAAVALAESTSKPLLFLACIVGGAGAMLIVQSLIKEVVNGIAAAWAAIVASRRGGS